MNEAYVAPEKPLLVDEYLGNAIELDVDAACDGKEVLIGAVMEHLEEVWTTRRLYMLHPDPKRPRIESSSIVEEWTRIIGLEPRCNRLLQHPIRNQGGSPVCPRGGILGGSGGPSHSLQNQPAYHLRG